MIPSPPSGDVLALPVRLQLVTVLTELLRPATTQELAERIGRHPNSVRMQLERLAEAGLLERRTVMQTRGRPRHEWAIAADPKQPVLFNNRGMIYLTMGNLALAARDLQRALELDPKYGPAACMPNW